MRAPGTPHCTRQRSHILLARPLGRQRGPPTSSTTAFARSGAPGTAAMADSWEDWETEEPVVPGIPAAPQAEASKSKFVGEDEGEEEDPKWKANVPAPQQVRPPRRCRPAALTSAPAAAPPPLAPPLASARHSRQQQAGVCRRIRQGTHGLVRPAKGIPHAAAVAVLTFAALAPPPPAAAVAFSSHTLLPASPHACRRPRTRRGSASTTRARGRSSGAATTRRWTTRLPRSCGSSGS